MQGKLSIVYNMYLPLFTTCRFWDSESYDVYITTCNDGSHGDPTRVPWHPHSDPRASSPFFILFNFISKESWEGFPPGPPNLPLIGSLPFLGGADMREPLRRMREKYGDVFTVYVGVQRMVVLASYAAIKEALVIRGHAFAGRPQWHPGT